MKEFLYVSTYYGPNICRNTQIYKCVIFNIKLPLSFCHRPTPAPLQSGCIPPPLRQYREWLRIVDWLAGPLPRLAQRTDPGAGVPAGEVSQRLSARRRALGQEMPAESHRVHRAAADGAGEALRATEVPVHAGPAGVGGHARTKPAAGEDVVSESTDEMEKTGMYNYVYSLFSPLNGLWFEQTFDRAWNFLITQPLTHYAAATLMTSSRPVI